MEINGSERLRFGAYEADLHTHELWKHGIRIKLVGQPFEILAVLVKRPGQLVTREELRAELWPGDTFVDFNHGLNAAVNKLRDALCDSADDPKYIETLPRRGYRFIAEVETGAVSPVIEARATEGDRAPLMPADLGPSAVLPITVSLAGGEGQATPVEAIPIAEPALSKPTNLRWLRYAVLGVALVLGLWRLANLLHSTVNDREERAKRTAEAATPATLTPLTALSDRTSDPAFSPEGTHVAFRRDSFVPGESGIWIKQVGGEELIQLTNSNSDCCPVWSPDGRYVAFSRLSDKQRTIYEVPAVGGEVREIYAGALVRQSQIDWSPDGATIAFAEMGRQGVSAIFLLSLENQAARQITVPSATDEDWGPAFSPDGNRIAFVRSRSIVVMPTAGGEIQRLTQDPVFISGAPAWAPDGQSIVFASPTPSAGQASLWRIPASGGARTPIPAAGTTAWNPALSRRGFRLACEVLSSARSIDQMDLYPPGQKARTLVTSMRGENAGQQLSPDGSKMAFQSDRSGSLEVWVSEPSGQNAIQLTAMGAAGTPRWSPNGKEIAFDVGLGRDWREPRALFLVNPAGGSPKPLVQDQFSNGVPSWSHDGNWVYFASNRSGDWQVWKIWKWGGSPVQVTKQGGFAAAESPDGQYLYYAKHRYEAPELWRVPVGGGDEMPVYPGVHPLDWAAWTVLNSGIVFVEGANDAYTVSFYDFSAPGVKHIASLDKPPFWVTATRDGKSLIFDQPGQEESHVMLLENFR